MKQLAKGPFHLLETAEDIETRSHYARELQTDVTELVFTLPCSSLLFSGHQQLRDFS